MNLKTLSTLALGFGLATSSFAFGFGDLQNWTGTGANQAALVIQWNDGGTPQSWAWGYRFDGVVSTEKMLQDIVTSDPYLYWYVGTPGSFGLPVYGLGYDENRTGVVGNGWVNTGSSPDAATPLNSANRWQVGWLTNGFWQLWEGAAGASVTTWSEASTGVSGSNLTNNSWRALSFAAAPNWTSAAPAGITAAVPEPMTLGLLGLGALALMRRKRQK